jgi:hypothetical protein
MHTIVVAKEASVIQPLPFTFVAEKMANRPWDFSKILRLHGFLICSSRVSGYILLQKVFSKALETVKPNGSHKLQVNRT